MNPYPRKIRISGFTLVELLVVITIIVVLAALSSLGVNRLRDSSRRAASIGNLRQLGIGMTTFVADNNNYLPLARVGPTYWPQVVYPYVGSADVFLRPGSKNVKMSPASPDGYFDMPPESAKTPEGVPLRWNYVINGGGPKLPICEYPDNPHAGRGLARTLSTIEQPDRTVLMAEGTTWWLNAEAKPNSNRMYRWKNGSTNVLFVDGSTRNLNCKTDLSAAQFLVD